MSFKTFLQSQRKNYFIHSKFQLKYSLLLAGLGTAISILTILSIIYFLNDALKIFSIAGLEAIPTLMEILNEQMSDLIITIIFVFTIQVVCLLLIGIYSTHKICGPIYVLEKKLRKLQKGIYSEKMSLRKSDDFQNIPSVFNRMLDKLQTRIHEDIVFLSLIESELNTIKENSNLPDEMQERLNKLRNQAQLLKEQKSYSLK